MADTDFLQKEPKEVWKYFSEISSIPRCSTREEGIRSYLVEQAKKRSLEYKTDAAGNLAVYVPASEGYESRPTAVIQGHMDMVCEKNSGTPHDFSRDPLKLKTQGDFLSAEGTTLGGDNGIALAMALALLDTESPHGPLELLFTSDEESGLTGALNLDPSLIRGRFLLNLDSEEEGVFYIGCAGGVTTVGDIPGEWEGAAASASAGATQAAQAARAAQATQAARAAETPESPAHEPSAAAFRLSITGLKGGHSGANIHEERGNAIKLGARLLRKLLQKTSLRISHIEGGGKHNAIPREFFAHFIAPAARKEEILAEAAETARIFYTELGRIDPKCRVDIQELSELPDRVLSEEATARLVNALYLIPHGVDSMSRTIEGLVETSSNLASVGIEEDRIRVTTSQRSSIISKRDDICGRVTAALRTAGAEVDYLSPYPAWTPDPENPLIDTCTGAYKRLFGQEPTVTAIHAGLESGVIGEKFPEMNMISFGPNLYEVHTPEEHLSISSVEHIWRLLLKILEGLNL
ncbi:MAG: aminoacyl-histidine dipeptidase [Spirochaetia bacterium]